MVTIGGINERIFTVSEVNGYVKHIVESDMFLNSFYMRGEIFNCKLHVSGHAYFTLKDSQTKVKAVMYKSSVAKLPFDLKDGMSVVVLCGLVVYERDGVYQLRILDVIPDGAGSLYIAFEQLKAKLAGKGYFSPLRKKELPRFPKKIAVVTSSTGAAIRDITTIICRRYPLVDIEIFSALVQGKMAAASIVNGLKYFDEKKEADLIIIGRGGGSIEELWAFNEEVVADEIFNTGIPVVSAVGHETDFTISDFVADLRASTPSAAAELCVPDRISLIKELDNAGTRMALAMAKLIRKQEDLIDRFDSGLAGSDMMRVVERSFSALEEKTVYLDNSISNLIEKHEERLISQMHKLEILSPLASLLRGYTYIKRKDREEILGSVKTVNVGDKVGIYFYDGRAEAEIIKREF